MFIALKVSRVIPFRIYFAGHTPDKIRFSTLCLCYYCVTREWLQLIAIITHLDAGILITVLLS